MTRSGVSVGVDMDRIRATLEYNRSTVMRDGKSEGDMAAIAHKSINFVLAKMDSMSPIDLQLVSVIERRHALSLAYRTRACEWSTCALNLSQSLVPCACE